MVLLCQPLEDPKLWHQTFSSWGGTLYLKNEKTSLQNMDPHPLILVILNKNGASGSRETVETF